MFESKKVNISLWIIFLLAVISSSCEIVNPPGNEGGPVAGDDGDSQVPQKPQDPDDGKDQCKIPSVKDNLHVSNNRSYAYRNHSISLPRQQNNLFSIVNLDFLKDNTQVYNFVVNNNCLQNKSLSLQNSDMSQYFAAAATGSQLRSIAVTGLALAQKKYEELKKTSCLVGISPGMNLGFRALGDPLASSQQHLTFLALEEARGLFMEEELIESEDIVIAVIDSGVDLDHDDLKDNVWHNKGEFGLDSLGRSKATNGVDDDGNGYKDDYSGWNFANRSNNPRPSRTSGAFHGTHVAGLAAARSNNGVGGRGVTGQRAKIMSLNVFGSSNGASTANIDNAIRYAADNGAHVINLSLGGGGYSQSTEDAILYALSKNVFIVAAAGNSSAEISKDKKSWYFDTPASFGGLYAGMIAVASMDSALGQMSDYTNYGPSVVELAAPGSENSATRRGLLSTIWDNKYDRLEGTSMASPVAAGAVALMRSYLSHQKLDMNVAEMEGHFLSAQVTSSAFNRYVENGRYLKLDTMAEYLTAHFPIEIDDGGDDQGNDDDGETDEGGDDDLPPDC